MIAGAAGAALESRAKRGMMRPGEGRERRVQSVGFQRKRRAAAACALAAALLAGCGALQSAGAPSDGLPSKELARAYQPLETTTLFVLRKFGASVALAPGVAVTNDHNADLIPEDLILARSQRYDLLFFSNPSAPGPSVNPPKIGAVVTAYGQGAAGDLREATGPVTGLDVLVAPRCARCETQTAFTFEAPAGKGFSGGPVVANDDGSLVGIVFGYRDVARDGGGVRRLIYAYPMSLVADEFERLTGRPLQP